MTDSFRYIVSVHLKSIGIGALACLLGACSQPPKPQRAQIKPGFVGVVDRVYPDQKYVLVRIAGILPAEGTTLISHAPEGTGTRVANLVVSPERLGNLRIPADIRSGAAQRGDLVFEYRGLAAPDPKGEDAEPAEPPTDPEKKAEEFPPGLPPGADGLLPAGNGNEMPVR